MGKELLRASPLTSPSPGDRELLNVDCRTSTEQLPSSRPASQRCQPRPGPATPQRPEHATLENAQQINNIWAREERKGGGEESGGEEERRVEKSSCSRRNLCLTARNSE